MFKVYWTNPDNNESYGEYFGNLTDALAECKILRECGRTFVTMVSSLENSIGKPGVDEIKDGVLPDGNTYDWKKRRK